MAKDDHLDYFSYPPPRIHWKYFLTSECLKRIFSQLWYFITLTLSTYESETETPVEITSANPSGVIDKDQLPICERMYEETIERNDHLTKKATSMLSSVAILVPLAVSALVYLATTANLNIWCYRVTVFIATFSMIFLFLGFFAAFRTLFIKSYASLYLLHIVDIKKKAFKTHSDDLYGRNLLWSASKNTAMNDHKADFIRASQLFITISVFLLLLSTTPLIYTLSPKTRVQKFSGEVQVTSKSLENSLNDIKTEINSLNAKFNSPTISLRSHLSGSISPHSLWKRSDSGQVEITSKVSCSTFYDLIKFNDTVKLMNQMVILQNKVQVLENELQTIHNEPK